MDQLLISQSILLFPQCPTDKEELCYILDENAIILISAEGHHAGKFFGSVEKKLMHLLIEYKVYYGVKVFDYQGVCYEDREVEYKYIMKTPGNSALTALLWNPFKSFLAILSTLISVASTVPSYMANCECSW